MLWFSSANRTVSLAMSLRDGKSYALFLSSSLCLQVMMKDGEFVDNVESVPSRLKGSFPRSVFPPDSADLPHLHLERWLVVCVWCVIRVRSCHDSIALSATMTCYACILVVACSRMLNSAGLFLCTCAPFSIRVLPHQQNTGGFFIVALRKVATLPWMKARPPPMETAVSVMADCVGAGCIEQQTYWQQFAVTGKCMSLLYSLPKIAIDNRCCAISMCVCVCVSGIEPCRELCSSCGGCIRRWCSGV